MGRMWNIPKMWNGGECWIIGGGPSIPYEFGVPDELIHQVQSGEASMDAFSPYLSPIHNRHVIAVNAAFLLGNWIDVIFFGDTGFFWKNKKELLASGKPLICSNDNLFPRVDPYGVKYTPEDKRHPRGISIRENHVSWNLNSGAAAISLARHFGVIRVYLLGFDMDVGEYDNQHFHHVYKNHPIPKTAPPRKRHPQRTFNRHMPNFEYVAQDAKRLGLEIINVSQKSKLPWFEKRTVKEILG